MSVTTGSKPAAPAANPSGIAPQTPVRWISWGPGSSAALSIACFILILGAVVFFQREGEKRAVLDEPSSAQTAAQNSQAEDTPAVTQGDAPGSSPSAIPMPVAAQSTATPAPAIETSLARARACAAASHWNCVLDAASSALAIQEGNTEAQSLLQRAIVNGGWTNETSSITRQTAGAASSAAAAPVPRSHARRHWHTAARGKSSNDEE
ncbi:hypothetical protein [Paraburkholderia rhizosphaerae]|uniref:hypothetical protein n=1 Tax=Paraburkholderia rhizosphaerae TaxID=480658 RepID=UPI001065C49B|nr:hypothetical protein [Paraburkholderia rhizosphaerae]